MSIQPIAELDNDYLQKKEKYSKKISQELIPKIIFTPDTINKINEKIQNLSYLKNVLKFKDITVGCSINNEFMIGIQIGDNNFRFIPYNKSLVSYNDILMISIVDELVNNTKPGDNHIDLTNENIEEYIRNCIILGYIFVNKLNKKIKFFSIYQLNPIARQIVRMVFEYNNKPIPEVPEEIPEVDIQC